MSIEFDLIQTHFTRSIQRDDVITGIGDDAAVLQLPANRQLVQSVDTLIEGVHFPPDTSPQDIAWKALAVNLSDMAAMAATPAWFTLALTLPGGDDFWLKAFSESLFVLASEYNMQLVGGDTTQGNLSITIGINGFVEPGKALHRHTARAGDKIYVSGCLGDAALALAAWQQLCLLRPDTQAELYQKLNRPQPRVALGQLLKHYATACIDISDGLVADLGHLSAASRVGAHIEFERIPLSAAFSANLTDEALMIPLVLSGGDDYELCFTIPAADSAEFEQQAAAQGFSVSCIGEMEDGEGVRCFKQGERIDIPQDGYQHFANT